MPPFFISLVYAFIVGLFAVLTGGAIEKRDYRSAAIWGFTALGILVNGALHLNRVFTGAV